MPHNPEAFADLVVMTVKSAMAPLMERLAAAEARLAMIPTVEHAVHDVRDRLVVVETKAAMPIAPPPVPAPPIDIMPVCERLAAAEARLTVLGDLRDRVVAVEVKAATVTTPAPETPSAADVELALRNKLDPVTAQLSQAIERIASLESRAPVPGPAGLGGKDGRDGKDGLDGVGWDDLSVEHDGERQFSVKLMRGERVKDAGSFIVPVDIYRGVWSEGTTYQRGDGVTWGGSEWHCNESTATKPGDGSKAWTLKVKRGRDGRDGRDASPMPVVSVPFGAVK